MNRIGIAAVFSVALPFSSAAQEAAVTPVSVSPQATASADTNTSSDPSFVAPETQSPSSSSENPAPADAATALAAAGPMAAPASSDDAAPDVPAVQESAAPAVTVSPDVAPEAPTDSAAASPDDGATPPAADPDEAEATLAEPGPAADGNAPPAAAEVVDRNETTPSAGDAAEPADAPAAAAPVEGTEVAAVGDAAAPAPPVPAPAAPAAATPEPPQPDPAEPLVEAESPLSPEAAQCLELAGPVDAGVPVSAAAGALKRSRIAEAATLCTAAAAAADAPPEVLFLAAEVAQARRDLSGAFDLLERAADAGLAAAQTRLGDYHLFGIAPAGEDAEAAIAHYQRAAAGGDPAGMTTLALMYRVGKGVPRDPARMVALLEDAADAGYHFAIYRLAQTYMTGEGIPGKVDDTLGIPDPARGAALYAAAAEAGNITAALELAGLYGDPASGLADDPAERARLTLLASRSGLPEAIAAMASLYETGDGVDYDPQVAALLYVRALETGKVGFDTLRRTVRGGWDRDTARAFQTILQERGLYDGAIDGIVGRGTASAAAGLVPQ